MTLGTSVFMRIVQEAERRGEARMENKKTIDEMSDDELMDVLIERLDQRAKKMNH